MHLITFDVLAVSRHANHQDTYLAVKRFLYEQQQQQQQQHLGDEREHADSALAQPGSRTLEYSNARRWFSADTSQDPGDGHVWIWMVHVSSSLRASCCS